MNTTVTAPQDQEPDLSQNRFNFTARNWHRRIALSTFNTVKNNGWGRFIAWIDEGNMCLLVSRVTRGGTGHDRIERQPVLAVAVPTPWVDKVRARRPGLRASKQIRSSYQVRRDFQPLCRSIFLAAAEGRNLHVESRLYHRAGRRAMDHQDAAFDPTFTLVGVPWFLEALSSPARKITEEDLQAIDTRLPWA